MAVRVEIRPRTAIVLLFVVLLVSAMGSIVTPGIGGEGDDEIRTETLADGSELYPYTSRGETTSERTLALNLVVYGDADTTEHLLRERSAGDWEEVEDDEFDVAHDEESFENGSTVAWGTADGAVRYVYVDPPGAEARWIDESYQLKDGTYLGERHHIRAYVDPADDNWTAMQTHWEHWDWFELRHSVHSIEASQSYVESEFFDRWYVEDLRREWVGNDRSSDGNGWVTVVELRDELLAAALGSIALASFGVRIESRRETIADWWDDESVQTVLHALLVVAAIVAVYSGVRIGAVEAELLFSEPNPKPIVAVFYPILVCGLPIVAYLSARQLESVAAFTAATIGFTVALFFDVTHLGVTSLALPTFVHRIALAIALGFVAAGASQTARSPRNEPGHVRTGVLLWVVAVAIPIVQHL